MKTAPPRSPSRRTSPPPPPRMSHRSPGFRRGRSPERRRRVDSQSGGGGGGRMSPSRSRERREFRPSPRSQPPDFAVPRRSRSPIRESRRRSFSPKKKSPKRDRERREQERERSARPSISRKRSRSKSPPVVIGPILRESASRLGPYSAPSEGPPAVRSYQGPESYTAAGEPVLEVEHSGRSISSFSERPDGSGFDKSELKKMTIVVRSCATNRPVFCGPERTRYDLDELKTIKQISINAPLRVTTDFNPEDIIVVRRPGEGSRPIFAREEIKLANERSKYDPGSSYEHRNVPTEEHERVVAIFENPPHTQTSGGNRFESPGRYPSSHAPVSYFEGDREHGSSSDYVRSKDFERSHGPGSGYDSREKNRDDHFERRDDLRHDLELRRRDDSRYSSRGEGMRSYDKGRDYRESDRGSDLRMRIHEKRSDRHDDHEMGHRHPVDRHDMERERDRERDRRSMMQHSPPPSDRRRGPIESGYLGDGDRKMRGDMRMGPGPHGGPSGRRNDGPDRFNQDPEFGPRPERFHASKPWDVNPEYVPKGRAYFEHDNRDEMRIPNRGRGSMGMRGHMRGRGMMRGRMFRGSGPVRGYMGGRGTGRRGGYVPRGFYNVY